MNKINAIFPRTKVGILYGGRSSEHEVSLASATNVIQNLDQTRFEAVPIGIDKQGTWYLGDEIANKPLEALKSPQFEQCEKMLFTPSFIGKPAVLQRDRAFHLNNSGRLFDVVFPVIHGPLCEDGTIQGFLELANVPYVGCGVLASAVGMDKDIAKRLAKTAGANVASYVAINRGQWDKQAAAYCAEINKHLTFPVFVKPANSGSSVGVYKVKTADELVAAINQAFLYDTKILVETGIDAIELEVSVLESKDYGADPIVSVIGEIRPQNGHEFYSYEAKYRDDKGAALIIPAPIAADIRSQITTLAKKIFLALECEGMARIDLFLERGTNQIYFNEINSIPGFTEISMYPKLMTASGITYSNLLTHLIDLAIARHERKNRLIRNCVD